MANKATEYKKELEAKILDLEAIREVLNDIEAHIDAEEELAESMTCRAEECSEDDEGSRSYYNGQAAWYSSRAAAYRRIADKLMR